MGVQFAGNILVQSNGGPLPISSGGTGQTTAATAINALLPTQTGESGKVLTTNGTNVSWSGSILTPGGADTQIQFNDAGTFGGNAFFTVNKSTGALTSSSTFSGIGINISDTAGTLRTLGFRTAGSDRWLMQTNTVAESGSNVGSNFQFSRVADNGSTSNLVYTVSRTTGVVDFKVDPTVNGSPIGGVASFNTRTGAITLTSGDVTTALTFTPYDATNPSGYTTNTGTVTSVAGTGTVSGLTLTGSVTTSGSLTLGGTLSLTSGDVTTALGYTPATGAANALTGTTLAANVVSSSLTSVGTLTSVTVSGTATATSVSVASTGQVYAATLTTSATTANQVVASAAIATYRSVKYVISITSGSAYQYTEVAMIHDGTNVHITENCTVRTGATLATFTADISSGNMRLLTTPVNAVTVIKSIVTAIVV